MGEKKKILYIITKSAWGGAQRYVYDLATHLPTDRYEANVALGGTGLLLERLRSRGIRTLEIRSLERDAGMGDLSAWLELYRLIRRERPDIVHLNSSKAGILGSLAARMLRVETIIFTAHGWAHTEERPVLSRALIKSAHFFTVLLSHTVITVSETTRNEMRIFGRIPKRLVVIHNGIETPEFLERERARESLSRTTGAPRESVWIGILAELHPNKGLRYAVEAAAKLRRGGEKQFSMIVIGEGEERGALEKLIRERSLEEHVFLAGFRDDAGTYLKAFDIFVLPSVKEGFPYSILEAGAAGLAVAASDTGGIRELISRDKTGITVRPRDTDALARALTTLARNPEERRRLGAALCSTVREHFTLERMLAETTALYR